MYEQVVSASSVGAACACWRDGYPQHCSGGDQRSSAAGTLVRRNQRSGTSRTLDGHKCSRAAGTLDGHKRSGTPRTLDVGRGGETGQTSM
jgi:hypothetical protein